MKDYEEAVSLLGGMLVTLLEIEKILNLLGYPTTQLILDVGTGTGRVARKLVTRAARYLHVLGLNRQRITALNLLGTINK